MKFFVIASFTVLLIPMITYAEVRITEIAWMGTEKSQYSEWIELYNDNDTSINLENWKLYEMGDILVFTFTKSIAPHTYLLLERTTASAPDAVFGIDDESGSFGGGGLANNGEQLVLKDNNGNKIESLDFIGGWPAGDAKTKDTMQWNGTKWVTAVATPKVGLSSENNTNVLTIDKKGDEYLYPLPKTSPNKPYIEFNIPDTVYSGLPTTYHAQPILEYKQIINRGSFYWNMGDGTVLEQQMTAPVLHTYQYPGVYTISFSYTDTLNQNNSFLGTKKVIVLAPAITIAIINRSTLEIKNSSLLPIDLTGWAIIFPTQKIFIPSMTIVAEQATINIPFSTFSIQNQNEASIMDPSGTIVATTVQQKPSKKVHATTQIIPDESRAITDSTIQTVDSFVDTKQQTPTSNRTKSIIFGAVALFVIGLSILLERFMAR